MPENKYTAFGLGGLTVFLVILAVCCGVGILDNYGYLDPLLDKFGIP